MKSNDSKSIKQVKPHHLVFWVGFGLLMLSLFFFKENRLSFWIAVTTNVLTAAVLYFEVKNDEKPFSSGIRKKFTLLGLSLVVLIVAGVLVL